VGRERVRRWGDPTAVAGEKPMAVDNVLAWNREDVLEELKGELGI
jgi:hypothetical protein